MLARLRLALALTLAPTLAPLFAGSAACAPPCMLAPPADVTTDLQVGGMVCDSCSQAISAALRKLDGVHDVRIDHVTGQAVIRHDPARTDRAALVAAVTALGYTVAAPR